VSSTVYARVSLEAKAWLDAQSEKTGIPIAKIIDTILVDAARRDVTFEVRSPVLILDHDPSGKEDS
jgi:hypothetical protein